MAYHRVPSPQANPISANIYPQPTLHRLHGQNPHVAGDDQQGGDWEDILRQVGDVAMPGEIRTPRQTDAPNYNAARYPPPPQPYQYPLEVPYAHMHQDDGLAEAAPGQAYPFAPEVQDNHDVLYDNGPHLPAADPLEAFPGVQPHTAPPAGMSPANDLRYLAGRFLNNPDTLVNMLRIEPRPGGRLVVWIALELAAH